MHRLTFVFALLATLAACVHASAYDDLHQLFKRDLEKTPYETLPDTKCSVPNTCASFGKPSECRCGPLLTICRVGNQFCWGSQTLTKTQGCPSTPSGCNANLNGTASCLCNDNTLLCVDGYRHYCYGTFSGSAAQAQVSISSMPSDGGAAAAAASSSSAKPAASSDAAGESAASTLTVLSSTLGVAIFGAMLSLAL